jgi:hypothetical protein
MLGQSGRESKTGKRLVSTPDVQENTANNANMIEHDVNVMQPDVKVTTCDKADDMCTGPLLPEEDILRNIRLLARFNSKASIV